MSGFHYEWWTVDIKFLTGTVTCEFKGKSKDHVISQIKKEFAFSNSAKNRTASIWLRRPRMLEVLWDTMQLDRTGYQRMS